MFYSLTQEELRSMCKNSIETFEVWARRIIHEKLCSEYGENYFDIDIGNNEKVLNNEHFNAYNKIKQVHPSRCCRPVDALFIETLIYILCKESIGAHIVIECRLIQNKPWHKHGSFDHRVTLFFQVLPNLKQSIYPKEASCSL